MECIFCNKKTCLVNKHGIQINKLKASNEDLQMMHFKLYTKHTEKVHGTQFGHLNHIPISLFMNKLVWSLAPDKNGILLCQWKMINWLDTYQLEEDEVVHIHIELHDDNSDIFIKKSPNPSAWEISNSAKRSILRQLDICFTTWIHSSRQWYIPTTNGKFVLGSYKQNEIQEIKIGQQCNIVKETIDCWYEYCNSIRDNTYVGTKLKYVWNILNIMFIYKPKNQ